MNSLAKSLTSNLKLLLKRFPDKTSINLSDAKKFISNSLNIDIYSLDDKIIYDFLKQKGYKNIIKKELNINQKENDFNEINFDLDSIDIDLDLESLLNFDLNSYDYQYDSNKIEKINIKYEKINYNHNKSLLEEFEVTKDPILLEDILNVNKNLVYKYVKLYNKFIINNTCLDENDLFQAGMIGLHKAILRYDTKKGSKFSTYAVFWIKQSIDREIMNNVNTIRLPVHLNNLLIKLNNLELLQLRNSNTIDIEQICNELNISIDKYNDLKNIYHKFSKLTSLDITISDDSSDMFLCDIIGNNNAFVDLSEDFLDPIDIVSNKIFTENILNSLDCLNEKERDIILLRFGFLDGFPKTLESIGSMYNLSRERIRQIESKALSKLKRSKYLTQLASNTININYSKPIKTTKSSSYKANLNNKNLSSIKKYEKSTNSDDNIKKRLISKERNKGVVYKNKSINENSISYNIPHFNKAISNKVSKKMISKYKNEFILREEYYELALLIKIMHTKCRNEFYTNPSTLLKKKPVCPYCNK